MASYTASDVLNLWEQSWGALPEKWKSDFAEHPAVLKILKYPDEWIEIAISRNRKLDDALQYLVENEKTIEPIPYHSQTTESDEMIDNLTKTIRNGSGSTIPPDDWWRDQV
jgi:hypothetical protein